MRAHFFTKKKLKFWCPNKLTIYGVSVACTNNVFNKTKIKLLFAYIMFRDSHTKCTKMTLKLDIPYLPVEIGFSPTVTDLAPLFPFIDEKWTTSTVTLKVF